MRSVLVLLALLLAAPVAAQPAGPAPAPVQPELRREKIKKRIRALRACTLTEELALDEPTAAKLFPGLAKYDDEFDKLLTARAAIQRRLVDARGVTGISIGRSARIRTASNSASERRSTY